MAVAAAGGGGGAASAMTERNIVRWMDTEARSVRALGLSRRELPATTLQRRLRPPSALAGAGTGGGPLLARAWQVGVRSRRRVVEVVTMSAGVMDTKEGLDTRAQYRAMRYCEMEARRGRAGVMRGHCGLFCAPVRDGGEEWWDAGFQACL